MIRKSNADIKVSPLAVLKLYEVEMRQVLQNLITNAMKFTENRKVSPYKHLHHQRENGRYVRKVLCNTLKK